ncbi:MAG: hypothetical protein IH977_16055 [Nitrospinae bacterium]|nr:hypothetical protein [Nitrospinota bacterium]
MITAIREGTEKVEAIGSEQFQEEMERRIQRRVTRLGYGGRPEEQAVSGGGIRYRINTLTPCFSLKPG